MYYTTTNNITNNLYLWIDLFVNTMYYLLIIIQYYNNEYNLSLIIIIINHNY